MPPLVPLATVASARLEAQLPQPRKRVERVFGWIKHVAAMRQTKFRGRRRVAWMFPTGSRRPLILRRDAASAAATGVVPRAECVHRPKIMAGEHTQSGRDRKTTHGKMEREKHPISSASCSAVPFRARKNAGFSPSGTCLAELKRIYETRSRPVWCTVKSRQRIRVVIFYVGTAAHRLSSGRSPAAPPP